MIFKREQLFLAAWIMASALLTRPSQAYVDLAPTIVKVIEDSKSIAVVELSEFDQPHRKVTFKEVKLLKGPAGMAPLVHQVAASETAIIPRAILQWTEPGALAVVFSSARTALVCLGPAWYQIKKSGDTWTLGADRPELALTYYGSVSRLAAGLQTIIAGGDTILTMMPHVVDQGASFDLSLNRLAYPGLVRLERVRANLRMPGTVWSVSNNPDYMIGMGSVDEEELPQLVRQLGGADVEARAAAAADIRQLTEVVGAAKTGVAVPALEKCLGDSAPRVQALAAAALLRITHGHDASVKVLQRGLTSADRNIRRDAANAAAVTGKAGTPFVPVLIGLLKDKDDAARFAALQAIGTLGPIAADARDSVVPLLDSQDLMIDAADALGRMGPRAQPVPPQMVKMLKSEQSLVRQAALRDMAQIGGKEAIPAAEYIAVQIGKADEIDAYNMVEYLALLGPIASVPAARIKSIPIPNPILTGAANWVINAPSVLPWEDGATEGIGDLGNMIYSSFVKELGTRLKPCALTLAPLIIAGRAGRVPDWGYKILNAAPEESLAVIAPHLADPDKVMRERAAIILGRMGPPAAGARKTLEAALAAAPDEREKNLHLWALREINRD